MKKLTLILATLMALPTVLSCDPTTPEKPRSFFQRIADHSGKIICGVCALLIGYFLLRKPAQKPVQTNPPGGPKPPASDNEGDAFDLLEQQKQAEAKNKSDFFARQKEKHQQHLARQAAAEKAQRDAQKAAQEKEDAALAQQLSAERPANSFDREVDRPPKPQEEAVSLLDDVD